MKASKQENKKKKIQIRKGNKKNPVGLGGGG